jgi:uncharacterized protein (TIGR02246 family)
MLMAGACATVPAHEGGADQVRALVVSQVAAWNRGDLEGFCAGYADDAVFVAPSGVTHGRDAVLARYLKKYGGDRASMGTLAIEPLDVRQADGAVSVAARWTLTWDDKPLATGSTVIVFTRVGGAWRIVHDASM